MFQSLKIRHAAQVNPLLVLGLLLSFARSGQSQNSPDQNSQTEPNSPAIAQNPAPNTTPAPISVRLARLSRVEGDVGIIHAGNAAREQGVANMPVQEGDTLSTAGGIAQIEFDDGVTAYLNRNSQLEFTHLAESASGLQSGLTLKQGSAFFSGNFTGADTFTLSTAAFELAIAKNVQVRVDTLDNDGASVNALQGSASVTTKFGATTLNQGQGVTIHQSDTNQAQSAAIRNADDFDVWAASLSRAQLLGGNSEMQSWSSPVYYGYADLATYGTWVNAEGVGVAWRPYAAGANWRPNLNGTWINEPGLGWTWVSFEPWGWLPYHYGTWDFASGAWMWIPPAADAFRDQWWPARVDWIRNGTQVGWVAMSPHDTTGMPANLAHGLITPAAASQQNTQLPNQVQVLDAREMRAIAPVALPPSTFVASALPAPTELPQLPLSEYARGVNGGYSFLAQQYMNPGLSLTYGPQSGLSLVGPQPLAPPAFPSTPAPTYTVPSWQYGPGGVRGFGSPPVRVPRVFPPPALGQPYHYVFPVRPPGAPSHSGAPRASVAGPRSSAPHAPTAATGTHSGH